VDILTDLNSGTKNRSSDRILELKVIDNKAPISSTGLIDKRLFSGENRLHGIADPQYGHWSFKYDNGTLPPVLKEQRFTSFKALFNYAQDYFKKRNIEITEVID